MNADLKTVNEFINCLEELLDDIEQGIHPISYHRAQLDDIKTTLIKEANENAR